MLSPLCETRGSAGHWGWCPVVPLLLLPHIFYSTAPALVSPWLQSLQKHVTSCASFCSGMSLALTLLVCLMLWHGCLLICLCLCLLLPLWYLLLQEQLLPFLKYVFAEAPSDWSRCWGVVDWCSLLLSWLDLAETGTGQSLIFSHPGHSAGPPPGPANTAQYIRTQTSIYMMLKYMQVNKEVSWESFCFSPWSKVLFQINLIPLASYCPMSCFCNSAYWV